MWLRRMEEWRKINIEVDSYEVSDLGRVRNGQRVLKLTTTPSGYLKVELPVDGKRKTILVHRLVAQAFIPNPEQLPQVNHQNHKRDDNRVVNLEWVTASENSSHAQKHRRSKTKVRIFNLQTKETVSTYDGLAAAAEAYDCTTSHLARVMRGNTRLRGEFGVEIDVRTSPILDHSANDWKVYPSNAKYEASRDGRVRNTETNRILRASDSNGYSSVVLFSPSGRTTTLMHRIVAETWLPPENASLVVNHKDANKTNNHIDNLEWVTLSQNTIHSYQQPGRKLSTKAIAQFDRQGKFIRNWDSTAEAARHFKISGTGISRVLLGQKPRAVGFTWKYVEESK
jgi:hypothetical protein